MNSPFPREGTTGGAASASAPGPFPPPEWLAWQLADSAFPTGGFAHSSGLEAAWRLGGVRTRADLRQWIEESVGQAACAAVPLVTACHADPARWIELGDWSEAFLAIPVARRASLLQGRALRLVADRVFSVRLPNSSDEGSRSTGTHGAESGKPHWAPVFGAVSGLLGLERRTAVRLFLHLHVSGVISAGVRLSLLGPIDARAFQWELWPAIEGAADLGSALAAADAAQTSPWLDLWQGAHEALETRLFQS